MSSNPRHGARDWEPASSRPGEVFTPEGQIASAGAFARGLKRRDPRSAGYRRSMLMIVSICLAACAAIVVLAAALG